MPGQLHHRSIRNFTPLRDTSTGLYAAMRPSGVFTITLGNVTMIFYLLHSQRLNIYWPYFKFLRTACCSSFCSLFIYIHFTETKCGTARFVYNISRMWLVPLISTATTWAQVTVHIQSLQQPPHKSRCFPPFLHSLPKTRARVILLK